MVFFDSATLVITLVAAYVCADALAAAWDAFTMPTVRMPAVRKFRVPAADGPGSSQRS